MRVRKRERAVGVMVVREGLKKGEGERCVEGEAAGG